MSPLSARAIFDFKPLLPLLFLLLLQLVVADPISLIDDVVSGMESRRKWDGVGEQRECDYFILSLQWPATTCNGQHHCCSSNACCRGSDAPTEFTIHGLWPQYNDGRWPSCCSTSDFNQKEISTLLDSIQKYWPSLSCGKPVNCHHKKGSFWAHEWEKHGTCSFPAVRDEYNYFSTTLNLYLNYNVTNVLRNAGYVPSDTEKYPLGGIIAAIENAFHETPMVTCSNGAVKELWLCFYKDFKPRDCVHSSNQNDLIFARNSCPKYVSLPTYRSGDERLERTAVVQGRCPEMK